MEYILLPRLFDLFGVYRVPSNNSESFELVPSRRMGERTSLVCQKNKGRVIYTRYDVEDFEILAVFKEKSERTITLSESVDKVC